MVIQGGDALPTNAQFDLSPNWLNQLVIGPHVPHLRAWARAHPEVQILAGHMGQSFFAERARAGSEAAYDVRRRVVICKELCP